MRLLIYFAILLIEPVAAFSQPGFGFSYTHRTIEMEEDAIENEYYVQYVFKRSPAEKAGLIAGDRIIRFHDATLIFANQLAMQNFIKDAPATIQMIISRKGVQQTVTITKADRSSYLDLCLEGECTNGKGTFVDKEGTTYTGSFKNGRKEGSGRSETPGGHSYQGSWKNDKREGKGIYVFKSDPLRPAQVSWTYEGDWKNDSMTGKGKMIFFNSAYYTGDFLNNNRDGQGKLLSPDSTMEEGTWKDNKLNGKGYILKKNGDKTTGNFVNGKPDGEVTVYKKESNITEKAFYKNGVKQ